MSDLVLAARELLREVTPLVSDCGRLCGAACCSGGDTDGMLLFPGEEELYLGKEGFSVLDTVLPDGTQARLLVCRGECDRNDRPLSCRIFPLVPYFTSDGTLRVRTDARGRPICPLARQKKAAMAPEFVSACLEAFRLLDADPGQHTFLVSLSACEAAFRNMKL